MINVLIVEDEPVLIKFYVQCLKEIFSTQKDEFEFLIANTFESAIKIIDNLSKGNCKIDLALIDLRLRNIPDNRVSNGLNLFKPIRNININTKIIILTSSVNSHLFFNIFDNYRPEGIIIKDEILDDNYFINAINVVIQNKKFYSRTVENFLINETFSESKIIQLDREILYLLSLGFSIKEISIKIGKSTSSIEKRKANLAELFQLDNNNKASLIKRAKEYFVI